MPEGLEHQSPLMAEGLEFQHHFLRLCGKGSCGAFLPCLPLSATDLAQKRRSDQQRRSDSCSRILESLLRDRVEQPQEQQNIIVSFSTITSEWAASSRVCLSLPGGIREKHFQLRKNDT